MRATSLPPKWTPSEESRRVILSECPNVDLRTEHPKFEDYWIGTGKPMKNWDAVWRNWMRRASERGPTRRTTSRSQQQLETNLAAWDLWAADDDDPPRKAIG